MAPRMHSNGSSLYGFVMVSIHVGCDIYSLENHLETAAGSHTHPPTNTSTPTNTYISTYTFTYTCLDPHHSHTGKTLAFVLPLVEKLIRANTSASRNCAQVVIIEPTRELAIQVEKEIKKLTRTFSSLCAYGGSPFGPQAQQMGRGVDFLVCFAWVWPWDLCMPCARGCFVFVYAFTRVPTYIRKHTRCMAMHSYIHVPM